jgi:antitoxin MazE
MQVSKWGNSLAIRLPAPIVKLLDLKEGDEIEVKVARKPGKKELLTRLRKFRGSLPADFHFDRDEANQR